MSVFSITTVLLNIHMQSVSHLLAAWSEPIYLIQCTLSWCDMSGSWHAFLSPLGQKTRTHMTPTNKYTHLQNTRHVSGVSKCVHLFCMYVCMYIFCTVQLFLWCLVTALTINVLHCLVEYVSCPGTLHECWVYSPQGRTFWTMNITVLQHVMSCSFTDAATVSTLS
jgi:hypothetical protein